MAGVDIGRQKRVRIITPKTDDERDALLRERVLAERVNDVVARPDSKRYQTYLRSVQNGFLGEPDVDPADEFREKAKELLPRAIEAYELKFYVTLDAGMIYYHEDFAVAAAPDAVDETIGLTFHIRQSLATYQDAIDREPDAAMLRHSQAMMAVTDLPHWVICNYYEDEESRIRKLNTDHIVSFDPIRAAQLLDALRLFSAKTRFKSAEAMA